MIPASELDPSWKENLLRVRHYTFGLPPGWNAEILQDDEEWLLLSLVGDSGGSGIMEFFSGALGSGEDRARRFIGASVARERLEPDTLLIEDLRGGGDREVSVWELTESSEEVRYLLFGGLPGILGGPSATWLIQGRQQGARFRVTPWPATTIASLSYDYRIGDIRLREGLFTFYGGNRDRKSTRLNSSHYS